MWNLYTLARVYGRRPSEIVGLSNSWTAYQFDSAVARWGTWVEDKLRECDKEGRPRHSLESLLRGEPEKKAYRDPLTGKVIWR